MKRLGNISVDVETLQNFREAFYEFSKHKRSRLSVQEFEEELEKKLLVLLDAYTNQKWKTSEYEPRIVTEPKVRVVNKLPIGDHVIQHAALYPVEPRLRDKIPYNCPAGTKGKGTHFFIELSNVISTIRHRGRLHIVHRWIYIIILCPWSIIY